MRWRRRRNEGTRSVLIGAVAVVGLATLALPLMPSLRRYLRMKRM